MFKLMKKLLIVGGVLAIVAGVVFGTKIISYVRTAVARARDSVQDQIPMDFEIDRARQEVAALVPAIRQHMHTIAEEEVEVARLEEEIAAAESSLDQQREDILALRADLETSRVSFRYGGRDYDRDQVERDLARRFERFQVAEATLASRRQILEARQRSLNAARDQLEEMIGSRRQLEVEVENLEARLRMVQAAQSRSEFQIDDTQLSQTRQTIDGLRRRLDVAQRLLDQEGQFTDVIPVNEPEPRDVIEEIDEYFGRPETERATAERVTAEAS